MTGEHEYDGSYDHGFDLWVQHNCHDQFLVEPGERILAKVIKENLDGTFGSFLVEREAVMVEPTYCLEYKIINW